MARRQKAATTTASPTNMLAKSDMTPSSPTQPERQNTNGRQGYYSSRLCPLRGTRVSAGLRSPRFGLTPNERF
jgi:hypothetical protein